MSDRTNTNGLTAVPRHATIKVMDGTRVTALQIVGLDGEPSPLYEVVDQHEDGTLVLKPSTDGLSRWYAGDPVALAEAEAELGVTFLAADGEG